MSTRTNALYQCNASDMSLYLGPQSMGNAIIFFFIVLFAALHLQIHSCEHLFCLGMGLNLISLLVEQHWREPWMIREH